MANVEIVDLPDQVTIIGTEDLEIQETGGGTSKRMQTGDFLVGSLINSRTRTHNFAASDLTHVAADIIVNGTFATDSDWTQGSGWSITAGVADCDGSQGGDSDLEQNQTLTSGKVYEVIFTVSSRTAGNIRPVLGGTLGSTVDHNGTFKYFIIAGGGGDPRFELRANSTFVGKIDNVTCRLISVDWNLAENQVTVLTLTASGAHMEAPTNHADGAVYKLSIIQGAAGGYDVTWNTVFKFKDGNNPMLRSTANTVDVFEFVSNGTNLYGSHVGSTPIGIVTGGGEGWVAGHMDDQHLGVMEAALAGSFAMGDLELFGSIRSLGRGQLVRGFAGSGGYMSASAAAHGAFVSGYVSSGGVFGDAGLLISEMEATGKGSFVHGYVALEDATMKATSQGSIALGVARYKADMISSGVGAFAGGYCNDQAGITSSFGGSFAFGFVQSNNGLIEAAAKGAFALGYGTGGGKVRAAGRGSLSIGYATQTNGLVETAAAGSFASGYGGGGGIVRTGSSGAGAFAQGYAYGAGSIIEATAVGAFAQGKAVSGNDIQATAAGAFAQGDSTSGAIVASAANAAQFGQGTNAEANSLQVGSIMRLKGTVGVPTSSLHDGDIWVASNYVYVRSNGVSVKIV